MAQKFKEQFIALMLTEEFQAARPSILAVIIGAIISIAAAFIYVPLYDAILIWYGIIAWIISVVLFNRAILNLPFVWTNRMKTDPTLKTLNIILILVIFSQLFVIFAGIGFASYYSLPGDFISKGVMGYIALAFSVLFTISYIGKFMNMRNTIMNRTLDLPASENIQPVGGYIPNQPVYGQPNYNQPAYQQPTYSPPTYQQPTYQQPTYQQPAYQQPTYNQPAYQQPTYSQPTYQQPNYAPKPVTPSPIQPSTGQATYMQPAYTPANMNQAATQIPPPMQNTNIWQSNPQSVFSTPTTIPPSTKPSNCQHCGKMIVVANLILCPYCQKPLK